MGGRKYLYRCDAGEVPEIGTGHLRRGLLLARELKQRYGIETSFLIRENVMAAEMVRNSGFSLFTLEGSDDEIRTTLQVISEYQPDVFVLDRLDSEIPYVKSLKDTGVFVFTMEDHGSGADSADVVINVINAFQWDRNGKTPYTGPSYMVLPPVEPSSRTYKDRAETIFLSFGGYDHLDLTTKTLKALKDLDQSLRIIVVMRRGSPNSGRVEEFIREEVPGVEIFFDVKVMSELIREADLALVCGGLTLFEAMLFGLPSIVIAQYDHQLKTAEGAASRKAALNLGKGDEVCEETIREAVMGLIPDREMRERLGRKAQTCVNGNGLKQVADLLALVEIREWDTKFFGRRIAMLHPTRLNEAIVRHAMKYCREEDVDCLYYLADSDDPNSHELAEASGFDQVDVRLRMAMDLPVGVPEQITTDDNDRAGEKTDILVRSASDEDGPELSEITDKSDFPSRFFCDRNFSDEECRKLYRVWIRKSLKGRFGRRDRVFVAESAGKVVGFISCDVKPPSTGLIILVCVSSEIRGKSVGITLMREVMSWMAEQGLSRVEVVTQERNVGARALYKRAGFSTVEKKIWYHKWF
jgi:spore coat polysaccharide biosynthesis predicted glycosyltransferase SpsG/GNAT superfamily N-acetyltransferase